MLNLLEIPTEITYYKKKKILRAEPSLKGNIVPYAKRTQKSSNFRRRKESYALWWNHTYLLVLQKTQIEVDFAKVHDYLRLKMFYLPWPRISILLDFDSTVLTMYGKYIEEAQIGYNPHKRGARSYHPLLCFESRSKDFWHGVLRSGNVYTSSGAKEFQNVTLQNIVKT